MAIAVEVVTGQYTPSEVAVRQPAPLPEAGEIFQRHAIAAVLPQGVSVIEEVIFLMPRKGSRWVQGEESSRRVEEMWLDPALAVKMSEGRSDRALDQWSDPVSREHILHLRRTKESRDKNSLAQGGIRVFAFPLLVRGGSNEEIAQITGFEAHQIKNLRFRLTRRKKDGSEPELKPSSPEEEYIARSKAHAGKSKYSHGRKYSDEQKKSFEFARKIVRSRVLVENTTEWEDLIRIYRNAKKELSVNFTERIIREALWIAVKASRNGDNRLMDDMRAWGKDIGFKWFQS